MADILFLVHRLPYPPNKGDKVRSYHLLRRLCERHRVHLGTFIDDPEDERHISQLQAWCASVHVERIRPGWSRWASLRGLLTGEPLTLTYFRRASLAAWIRFLRRRVSLDAAVVYSAAMVPYAGFMAPERVLVDLVDADSLKWNRYAAERPWPLSWIYGREGRLLQAYEQQVVRHAHHCTVATERDAAALRGPAGDEAVRVSVVSNGVDTAYFAPSAERPDPFGPDEIPIVFTGVMNHWPNIDAVAWFVKDVLPRLRREMPRVCLYIVGRNPAPAVRRLAGPGVVVTGAVPDVRPYIQHAALAVAPLRIACGVQNKILEAMAMARPVIASRACVEALRAHEGTDLVGAEGADEFLAGVFELLQDPSLRKSMGDAARRRVQQSYDWGQHLAGFEALLQSALERRPSGAPAVPALSVGA